jgi:hypothetical protein
MATATAASASSSKIPKLTRINGHDWIELSTDDERAGPSTAATHKCVVAHHAPDRVADNCRRVKRRSSEVTCGLDDDRGGGGDDNDNDDDDPFIVPSSCASL